MPANISSFCKETLIVTNSTIIFWKRLVYEMSLSQRKMVHLTVSVCSARMGFELMYRIRPLEVQHLIQMASETKSLSVDNKILKISKNGNFFGPLFQCFDHTPGNKKKNPKSTNTSYYPSGLSCDVI